MANPSVHQAAFIGGEWALTSQGRIDKPGYKFAMAQCVNAMPVAEGAFVRRSGAQFLKPTYKRGVARILPYRDIGSTSYLIELTVSGGTGYAHYISGTACVYDGNTWTVSTSSSASGILTLVTSSSTGWSIGDQFKFLSVPADTNAAYYANRILTVKTIAGTTITAWDDMGVAFTFDSITNALTGATIARLLRNTHAFTNTTYFDYIRSFQAQTPTGTAFFMVERNTAPQVITGTNLAIATASFKDGPYLDPQGGALTPETGTVNAYSGTITFTPTSSSFVAADVGRHIRLFSEPAAWSSGTTYTNGQTVTYNGQWWVFVYSSGLAGVVPGTTSMQSGIAVSPWAPDPTAGRWAWGTISAQVGSSCTVVLQTALNSANGATISKWRLGLFMSGRYPACGIYHQGRLWFGGCATGAAAGAPQGRFDASTTDDIYTFSPTDIYGNVADNHAISYTLSGKRAFNSIQWFETTDVGGLIAGTAASEWHIRPTSGDALTPLSIRADEVTTIGSAQVDPIRAGIAVVFPHVGGRDVYEYLADAFSTRFGGNPINEQAHHLVASASADAAGYYRLAYQSHKVPVIWALAGGSALLGCTYRRKSRFLTEPPELNGWHRHLLYEGERLPVDVAVMRGGTAVEYLYMVLSANGTGITAYSVEVLRPLLDGES